MHTFRETLQRFREDIAPHVRAAYGDDDEPAFSEAWNDWTDGLVRDGELHKGALDWCPSHADLTAPRD